MTRLRSIQCSATRRVDLFGTDADRDAVRTELACRAPHASQLALSRISVACSMQMRRTWSRPVDRSQRSMALLVEGPPHLPNESSLSVAEGGGAIGLRNAQKPVLPGAKQCPPLLLRAQPPRLQRSPPNSGKRARRPVSVDTAARLQLASAASSQGDAGHLMSYRSTGAALDPLQSLHVALASHTSWNSNRVCCCTQIFTVESRVFVLLADCNWASATLCCYCDHVHVHLRQY